MRQEKQVGHQGRVQDDGNVGRVKQLDGVGLGPAAHLAMLDGQVHAKALEVDDHHEHQHRGQQVGDVGQVLAIKRFLQGAHLVAARDEQVEQGQDGALKLGAAARVDGGRRQRLPHNRFANVGGNEQRDARTKAVALLQQLVQQQHQNARKEQLDDDHQRVANAQVGHGPIHAGQHVRNGLHNGDDQAKQLLRAVEQLAVGLLALVHLDQLGARQQLHHQAGRDNGRNAQLHERAAVGRQDDAHPVERVRTATRVQCVVREKEGGGRDAEQEGVRGAGCG